MSLFQLLRWSLKLDYELLFQVDNIPLRGKTAFLGFKYLLYLKNTICCRAKVSSVVAFGGRFYYNEASGPASLQRVYCSSHFLAEALKKDAVVLDIGANIGQFNHFCRNYLLAQRIISIEPAKDSYELLRRNAMNPADCVCCAVSDKDGEVLFHVSQESSQLSSYVFETGVSYLKSYSIPVQTLDRLTQNMGIANIDLLKIDTEGSEFDVLKSAEETLRYTKAILIEMSVFRKNSGNLFQIGTFLEKRGFRLAELFGGEGRRPKDVDAFFVRH